MPATSTLFAFALLCLGLVLTPGPNMMYLVSRSICQGRRAAMVSLGGVGLGFLVYMLAAALGITALLFAVPLAYDVLRLTGAAYLLYLAWQALRPGGRSPFQVRDLPVDSNRRLFAMGFVTNLLNPKAAIMYLSLIPQFERPAAGHLVEQGFVLGSVQIAASLTVNFCIVLAAGTIANFLRGRPAWQRVQRYLMGTVLGALAIKLATDHARPSPA